MRKHAYLIMAHNNEYILNKLISLIDDERNDIFLHIDKKVDLNLYLSQITPPQKSHFFVIKNRINTMWGHISFVETELTLFEEAFQKGEYRYYHLISGVDLPIKSQNYIHNFFKKNDGIEFVGFDPNMTKYDRTDRVYKKHIATKHFKDPIIKRKICFFFDKTFIILQKIFNYKTFTTPKDFQIKKGCNWVSVTSDFVSYLLSRKKNILLMYKNAICPDELFIQTTIYNSPFRKNIYQTTDEYEGCMRLIDWTRGHPYVFNKDDIQLILNSNRLFARKFDIKNLEIVDLIYNHLNRQ